MTQNRIKSSKMNWSSWKDVRLDIHPITENMLHVTTTDVKNSTVIEYAPAMRSTYNALNHLESIYVFMPKHKEECEHFSEK